LGDFLQRTDKIGHLFAGFSRLDHQFSLAVYRQNFRLSRLFPLDMLGRLAAEIQV